MSLRGKTLLYIGVAITALVAVLYGGAYWFFLERFSQFEQMIAHRNVERVRNLFRNDVSQLLATAGDWASWDDTYRYIDTLDPAYEKENLGDVALTNLHIHFMFFVNAEGKIVAQRVIDPLRGEAVSPDTTLIQAIESHPVLLRHENISAEVGGFVLLPDGPALVASRPITDSTRKAPVKGALIIGRYLGPQQMEHYSQTIQLTLGLSSLADKEYPADLIQPSAPLSPDALYLHAESARVMAAYSVLRDTEGHSTLLLKVSQPREVFEFRTRTTRVFIGLLVVYGVLLSGVILLALDRQILNRLTRLGRTLDTVAASGDMSARVAVEGNDELSKLALQINVMLEALQRSRDELHRSETMARSLLDAPDIPALLLKPDGTVLGLNVTAARAFGLPASRLTGHNISELLPPALYQSRLPYFRQLLETCTPVAFEDEYNGVHWSHNVYPILGDRGELVYVATFSRNVTEQKQAAEALRESMQTTADIVNSIPSGLFTFRYEPPDRLNLLDGNAEAERIWGFSTNDWRGHEFNEIWPCGIESGISHHLLHVARTGEMVSLEKVPYRDDRSKGYFRIRIFSLPANKVALAFEDVTAQVLGERERQQLEEQLHHSQKMEAIGQLAGGVAHDFNNLLSGILGYASLLKLESPPDSAVYDAARTIEKAAERAADLTRQLLGFARRGKLQNTGVNVHDTLQDVIRLLGRTVDKNIRIVQNLSVSAPLVKGDPNQLQQVFLNLGVNARDAMPSGGDLIFATHTEEVDADHPEVQGGAAARTYLVASVTDEGCGIQKEHLGRVFEPFFTTKEQGRGTGMGLAMVYGIVKNHGGFVHVYSEVGQGSTFRVYLPLAAADEVQEAPVVVRPEPVTGSARILLVDDEEVIRNMGGTVLSRLGYTVTMASNGREALEYYREHADDIDLTIIDMVMPEMGGEECFRAMKEVNPQVRAILSSGYGFNGRASEMLEEGMLGFIQKPYHVAELSIMVAKALNSELL